MFIDARGAAWSFLMLAALPLRAFPASPDPGNDPITYTGSSLELAVALPLQDAEGIRVDGRLDEEVWRTAAVLTGFTQFDPVEGVPAAQPTRIRVFRTAEALHFGIEALDDDPSGIRATLSERDDLGADDQVQILLDTFHDQRRAYAFTVNPLGVQQDGLWMDGRGVDHNPDFLWESEGAVHDAGWTVEVRIPLKSLRFPSVAEQSWGINVIRRVQRTGYRTSWAPLTDDVANTLAQSGRLDGLMELEAGRLVELNPVVTASRVGVFDEGAGGLVRSRPEGAFGLNATLGVTSNLILDATYNPDFSQVEADAGQIVVNERFAQYLPEKRPFFLEGTEVFALPRQLVYTRSIVDPVAGAKLTGKVGSLNVGYLGALDEGSAAGDVAVNLLRVRRDVGGSSTVGALYTDRTHTAGGFNRVVGTDARLVFAGRWTVSLLGAASWDRDTGAAEPTTGAFFHGRLARSGRRFSAEAELEDAEADFAPESGFLRRLGETRGRAEARVTLRGAPGALLEQLRPFAEVEGVWDREAFWAGAGVQESDARLGLHFAFRGNLSVFATWTRSSFDFPVERYQGLATASGDPYLPAAGLFQGLDALSARAFLGRWERIRGGASLNWSRQPVFAGGAPVELAESLGGSVDLTLLATPALRTELGVRYQRLDRVQDGTAYSSALIPRVRMQYQFSRALFLRGVFEYAAQKRGAPADPTTGEPLHTCSDQGCTALSGFASNDLHLEGLLSYEPSPGTVFFLGYSRAMEEVEAFRFQEVRPSADGLFLKLSYRFRL